MEGTSYTLRVEVQMNEYETIFHLRRTFNIKSFMIKNPTGNRRKTSYRIGWSGEKAADLLKKLLPLLHGKKKQAKVAIQFQRFTKRKKLGKPLTKSELQLRESYYLQLRLLKEPSPVKIGC